VHEAAALVDAVAERLDQDSAQSSAARALLKLTAQHVRDVAGMLTAGEAADMLEVGEVRHG
jgi:hypothetical protein